MSQGRASIVLDLAGCAGAGQGLVKGSRAGAEADLGEKNTDLLEALGLNLSLIKVVYISQKTFLQAYVPEES